MQNISHLLYLYCYIALYLLLLLLLCELCFFVFDVMLYDCTIYESTQRFGATASAQPLLELTLSETQLIKVLLQVDN